jgi:hypothetical protein
MTSPIQEVMARVIRMTRVKDSSYLADMDEWLAEGMGLMQTRFTLVPIEQDITINFHKGKLPRGIEHIEAVALNGRRLKRANGIAAAHNDHHHHRGSENGTTNGFEFLPQLYAAPAQENPQENSFIYTQDLTAGRGLPEHGEHWYDEDVAGFITTSLQQGRLRIYARSIPLDEEGLPLIPNNEHYKQALYFYCRGAMIGCGYEDRIFKYDDIMGVPGQKKGHFWFYAEKAIGEIIYPDVNSMEAKMNANLRLIKDEHFFDKFFTTLTEERRYGWDEFWEGASPSTARTFKGPSQNGQDNWGATQF